MFLVYNNIRFLYLVRYFEKITGETIVSQNLTYQFAAVDEQRRPLFRLPSTTVCHLLMSMSIGAVLTHDMLLSAVFAC